MSEKSVKAIDEISKYLSQDDILKLRNYLNIPSGVCQDPDPVNAIYKITQWRGYNSVQFMAALKNIHPNLIVFAQDIPWITVTREVKEEKTSIMQQFIEFLCEHLEPTDWKKILLGYGYLLTDPKDNMEIFRLCLKAKIISKDFTALNNCLEAIGRFDVIKNMVKFRKHFENWLSNEFISEFRREALEDDSEIEKWHKQLLEYTCSIFEEIEPILGSSISVKLEEMYTPLTIIKFYKSEDDQNEQESGQTEIDLLRKIHKRNLATENILETLKTYNPNTKKAWCLIGNPGCGKTWLCNRIALMFGKGHLPQFHFSISIPCRNQEWHSLEETRIQKGRSINSQSLQDWLLLGMPLGASWTEDLAKHLVKTEGEGLLLVIDSIDEFLKTVPMGKTILSALLMRRTLYKSSLLVTSRPAAWSQISSTLSDIKINNYHQVLGFSPKNRDLYISKRLKTRQLKLFNRMISLHDEIALLCLIPVNASLFTAIFQLSDAIAVSTLTQLYSQLFLYLIRRQLSRMKLRRYGKVEQLFELDKGVLNCLYSIGEVAYKGVSARELTSTARFRLRIVGEKEQDSECLGLVQVQVKETTPGVKTELWCFAHLTLQEFTAALYLYSINWRHLSVLTRYIVSTRDVFNIYRMVIRFSCGLLSDNAAFIVPIVFKYQLTSPVPNIDMSPLTFKPNDGKSFSNFTGWNEFTVDFPPLITLIAESQLTTLYSYINNSLQESLYFYFKSNVPLNDWNNFVTSLPHIQKSIRIWIDLKCITTEQLQTLLQLLPSCSVQYLALYYFAFNYTKLEPFCRLLAESPALNTKISIQITTRNVSELTETSPILNFYSSKNQNVSGLGINELKISENVLKRIINRISSLQCLDFIPDSESQENDWNMVIKALPSAKQLEVFRFSYNVRYRPSQKQELISAISKLTSLRELSLEGIKLDKFTLPRLLHLSQLTYLNIKSINTETVLQLVKQNKCTLKGLELNAEYSPNLTALLDILHTCTSLLQIELSCPFSGLLPISQPLPLPQSIVYVHIYGLKLEASGLIQLCNRIAFHTSIRMFSIAKFDLTPETCKYLCNLIPTLPQLKYLGVDYDNEPETTEIEQLKLTASQYSVKLEEY